jgi:hypothetical protein
MILEMIDVSLKLSLTIVLIVWLYSSGTIFESEYYDKLVDLYTKPWWKWLVIGLLIASLMWCPSFAMALTMGIFFYFADIEALVK